MAIPFAALGLLYALGSFIVYQFLNSFLRTRHNARRARELNCQDPPKLPTTLPLGFDVLQSALAADKNKEFPVELERRHAQVGANTYTYSSMGSTQIMTAG